MFTATDLRPMLASSPDASPSLVDPRAVYEPKYDGIRAIVLVEPGPAPQRAAVVAQRQREIRAVPRPGAGALGVGGHAHRPGRARRRDRGPRPSGTARRLSAAAGTHQRIGAGLPQLGAAQTPDEQPAAFVAFDLLRDGDDDLRARPLNERRAALEVRCADLGSPLLRLSDQAVGDGRALYAQADAQGWEGLVVKRAASRYRAGKRTTEWQKLKIQLQDEFVVGGWTAPQGRAPALRRAHPRHAATGRRAHLRGGCRHGLPRGGTRPRGRAAAGARHRGVSLRSTRPRPPPERTGCARCWSRRSATPR